MSDFDRPLNPRGRRTAPQMAQWMSENDCVPDLILCSSATRTKQTCDLLCKTWRSGSNSIDQRFNIEFIQELYLAPAHVILQTAKNFAEASDRLLVVVHNPGFELLASQLAQVDMHLPTASLAIFEADVWPDDWSECQAWQLLNVIRPREIGD